MAQAAPLLSVCLFPLLASLKLCNRRHCPFVALILLVSLPFLNAVALFHSDFFFSILDDNVPDHLSGFCHCHLSTLPLHAHYAIYLPFAFHALAHPCFSPLLSTSLLLPTTSSITSILKSTDRQSTNQSAELNERLPDLCFAICRFSHVRFITPSHLTHNLFFYFQ